MFTRRKLYSAAGISPVPVKRHVSVENYICHNGDFEFFQIGGEWYDTSAVQLWLEKATGVKMPSVVDSAAIAGVIDLLRTQGSWDLSVRYAFLFGVSKKDKDEDGNGDDDDVRLQDQCIPPWDDFVRAATVFDDVFLAEAKRMQQGVGLDLSVSQRDGGWRGGLDHSGSLRGDGSRRAARTISESSRGTMHRTASNGSQCQEGSTVRGNVFANVWGSLMSLSTLGGGGDTNTNNHESQRGDSRGGSSAKSTSSWPPVDKDESTRHSNRYNFRGDASSTRRRGSCFMIASSNSVMERLANRRGAIVAAALKKFRGEAGTGNDTGGGGDISSVLGLEDKRVDGGDIEQGGISSSWSSLSQLEEFCRAAVDAFFDNDLIRTSRMFLKSSRGSFGLCISSSLDADRQIALAARGQTMSVAFYPKLGLVLYGSEQAAVKAALGRKIPPAAAPGGGGDGVGGGGGSGFHTHLEGAAGFSAFQSHQKPGEHDFGEAAFRLDLDDLGGEICVLDWAGAAGLPPLQLSKKELNLRHYSVIRDAVTVTLISETSGAMHNQSFFQRLVPIEDNPLVHPLPESCDDPVAKDISDIPLALRWGRGVRAWGGGGM